MGVVKILYDELIGFFGLSSLIEIFKTGNFSVLLTLKGILSIVGPLIPFLLVFEIVNGLIHKKIKKNEYKIPLFTYVFNRFISKFLSITAVAFCIGVFQKYAILKTGFTWYWFVYSYIVWEFSHFIYHYLAHKIRLLWCLHSTHHAPESMNLSVTYAHFFLEAPYANMIRASICILFGVNPETFIIIMFIDGIWGAFIHVSENFIKDVNLGPLNRIILMPSHHRVHHGKNPVYMDTNFCSLLNIWDHAFGTFKEEEKDIPLEYGITRKVDTNNFFDVYFGEFVLLFKDVKRAPGIKNKIAYLIMPPGWSHTGNHATAKLVKEGFLKNSKNSEEEECGGLNSISA